MQLETLSSLKTEHSLNFLASQQTYLCSCQKTNFTSVLREVFTTVSDASIDFSEEFWIMQEYNSMINQSFLGKLEWMNAVFAQ